jgi:hypothetical protein
MTAAWKKEALRVLEELSQNGVLLRVGEDGRLKASHATGDGITDAEKAKIRKHSRALKEVIRWDDDKAKEILCWAMGVLRFAVASPNKREAQRFVADRLEICQRACEEEDMQRLRMEAGACVREARKLLKRGTA